VEQERRTEKSFTAWMKGKEKQTWRSEKGKGWKKGKRKRSGVGRDERQRRGGRWHRSGVEVGEQSEGDLGVEEGGE